MSEPTIPSQKFVEIKEIRDGVVYLKKGGMRKILIVSGVNFDLKSQEEQTQILSSFQGFLDTLDFPTQFFIHSRKVNIEAYLASMKAREGIEQNELLKIQIREYVEFIRIFVEENAIINKTFFIIVPYEPTSLQSEASGILSFFKKSSKEMAQKAKEATLQENLMQLDHRVNQALEGIERIGLRGVPLKSDELIELFYNLYNPQLVEKKGLEIAKP